MISERTLRRWRRDALIFKAFPSEMHEIVVLESQNLRLRDQVIKLTQELMDLYLIRKGEQNG